jgi:hypothetical protein
VVRAGDRAHLRSAEAGQLPAAEDRASSSWAMKRRGPPVSSAGGHSPPSSSTAAASRCHRPASSTVPPSFPRAARRLRTTTGSLPVRISPDLDRTWRIRQLEATRPWSGFGARRGVVTKSAAYVHVTTAKEIGEALRSFECFANSFSKRTAS